MDKYFFATIALIIFSIIVVLCVKLLAKEDGGEGEIKEEKPPEIESDSEKYDNIDMPDPLSHLKADDFTFLE